MWFLSTVLLLFFFWLEVGTQNINCLNVTQLHVLRNYHIFSGFIIIRAFHAMYTVDFHFDLM